MDSRPIHRLAEKFHNPMFAIELFVILRTTHTDHTQSQSCLKAHRTKREMDELHTLSLSQQMKRKKTERMEHQNYVFTFGSESSSPSRRRR